MSDILKNEALKAIQYAMSMTPIGGKNKAVKKAAEKLRNNNFFEIKNKVNTNQEYEKDDLGMNTNPIKPTLKPDSPKNTKKSKTHTARPRRAN